MYKFLFVVLAIPTLMFSQVDNIELPDVELLLEDQSTIGTDSVEEALLKDRNPQFQEVYLEELSSSSIRDSSYRINQSQRLINKYSTVDFGYGSYNNTTLDFHSQNITNNLLYVIDYNGLFKDNVGHNRTIYHNTQQYTNHFNVIFSYALTNTLIDANLSYQQKKQSFFTNINFHQQYHYIPISFDLSHWITEYSYIKFDSDIRTMVAGLEDIVGTSLTEPILTENNFSLSYHANFVDWNYFFTDLSYNINSYTQKEITHVGRLTIASDFYLGKGFTTRIGGTILGSSIDQFFGWPELSLSYSYYDLFLMKLGLSGDYDLFGAGDIIDKDEFFATTPLPDSKWILSLSLLTKPSAFFWIGSKISYNMYQHKNIYAFNPQNQLYFF
ncbi:MAG: hypothetical protein ACRCV0_01745 [Brevinema sp.]